MSSIPIWLLSPLYRTGCVNHFEDSELTHLETADYYNSIYGYYIKIRDLNILPPDDFNDFRDQSLQILAMAHWWARCQHVLILDGIPVGEYEVDSFRNDVIFLSARDDIHRIAVYDKQKLNVEFYQLPVDYVTKSPKGLSAIGASKVADIDAARAIARHWVAMGMWQDQETRIWHDLRIK